MYINTSTEKGLLKGEVAAAVDIPKHSQNLKQFFEILIHIDRHIDAKPPKTKAKKPANMS